MDVIPQIMLYMIGTFLNFTDFTRLSLTSKQMDKRTAEPRKMLAKREVMRLFSSDLDGFRMIIHSVSYEMGPQDYSTPTLNDGYDWLSILREGLSLKNKWPSKLKNQLKIISKILQNPENNLPSFHRNSFSKLETTMQENLFETLNNCCGAKVETISPRLELELGNFNNLENIYLLYAFHYMHNSNVIQTSPRISTISQFHHALVSYVKYSCKIHRISIMCRNNEEKPLQFLYEYAVRWNAYSNSMWKLSSVLSTFEQLVNESYTNAWTDPEHEFRVFRMMSKIWSTEVLDDDMVSNLKDAFKAVIRDHHKDLLQHIRDKSVLKDSTPMEAVLKKFFYAAIDISVNEKSVHFINSTDIDFDTFYNMFEAFLIKE